MIVRLVSDQFALDHIEIVTVTPASQHDAIPIVPIIAVPVIVGCVRINPTSFKLCNFWESSNESKFGILEVEASKRCCGHCSTSFLPPSLECTDLESLLHNDWIGVDEDEEQSKKMAEALYKILRPFLLR
ncbi:hypothetical protein PILCRDRAFT_115273 [Piloderma croceum F 1598]|uniref:Uncharacterized protein n=1 Tax=Piloderma croceum (strain F 1598) TaxID=765440 RepID=A0A0C3CRD0_PILCF|nr:hypothetical protein PILCRDRAFT_115273 [Piloderma croceum F 1598]